MASTCPNCGKQLHFWNVKAECSACGANIPNYNWEERLEEDNVKAEKAFTVFYRTLNRIAYSIWGTKLRIARLVLTFLPAIGFILPWATIKSDGTSLTLSIIAFDKSNSLINFFSGFFGDSGLFFTNMKLEGYGGPVTLAFVGYILFLLSALTIVIAFLMVIFKCKHPKTKSTIIFDIISILFSIASVVCFIVAGTKATEIGAFNFGNVGLINPHGGIAFGYFVALALLLVATITNICVVKADAKSDEQLEEERLARKAVKDEKERVEAEQREIARAEAAKKYEEEQAEKVAEAKAHLAEAAEKKKAKDKK